MKKRLQKLIFTIFIAFSLIFINMKVTTSKGINFKWHKIKIPLYLKILDFFDRHYNYGELVKQITLGAKTDQEKAMKIFKWAHENIRKTPEGLPIIDDHAWHIIIRGYGLDDQVSDVFTTLCNYAGTDAFFCWIKAVNQAHRIPLSFVKINGRWNVFDPYNGNYFKDTKGDLASIEEIIKGDWLIENIDSSKAPDVNYTQYLKNLILIKDVNLIRANIQSPFNRFKFEIKKWLKRS